MTHSVSELCLRFSDQIIERRGDQDTFTSIDDVKKYTASSLIFVSDASTGLLKHSPAVIVTTSDLAEQLSVYSATLLLVANVRLAQALIKQAYQSLDVSDPDWPSIHPSAVIHPSAIIGVGARIGPNSVIGENASIGNNVQIRANCVVERNAQIGEHSTIHNLVNIGQDCQLGARVIIRAGTIIGGEGFGYAQADDKSYQHVPHTGNVVIEDDVHIGTNCNVDRGTYGTTLIERGVKIDALCHIGHNCTMGEDSLFIAQSGMAGSSSLGKRVICSGQTGVLDHRRVADDCVLVHRCGVTEDLTTPIMWAGTPPKPLKEYVRDLNTRKTLEKKIASLQAQIDNLK